MKTWYTRPQLQNLENLKQLHQRVDKNFGHIRNGLYSLIHKFISLIACPIESLNILEYREEKSTLIQFPWLLQVSTISTFGLKFYLV